MASASATGSGAAGGFAVSFCAVPVDVVKINAQKMHVSAYESMRTLYKQRGLRFVAHGGVATLLHLTLSQMAVVAPDDGPEAAGRGQERQRLSVGAAWRPSAERRAERHRERLNS